MAEEKRNTDIFGNEYTVGHDGQRYYHHKSLFTGEDVTYGPDGKEYRTHDSIWGGKETYGSDGTTYTTRENIFGQAETYGSDGSEYVTQNGLFGTPETVQIKPPSADRDLRNSQNGSDRGYGSSSYGSDGGYGGNSNASEAMGNAQGWFEGLSKEQISKIFERQREREAKSLKKAMQIVSVTTVYHLFTFVFAIVCGIAATAMFCGNVPFLYKNAGRIMWIPIIAFAVTFIVQLMSEDAFDSIRLGIWINVESIAVSALTVVVAYIYERYEFSNARIIKSEPTLMAIDMIVFVLTIIQTFRLSTNNDVKSVMSIGARSTLTKLITLAACIASGVMALQMRGSYAVALRLPYALALLVEILSCIYCFMCYRQDRKAVEKARLEAAKEQARREKELSESEQYNVFIKTQSVHDEKIDNRAFSAAVVKQIKERAAEVAAKQKKPFDKVQLEIVRCGRLTTAEYRFDGWILEKYLLHERTLIDDAYETLKEIYQDDYYYVLEKNGELKVINIHVCLKELNCEPYAQVEKFYITKHDISFTDSGTVTGMIQSFSAMALDCQVPRQRERIASDGEIQVYDRVWEFGRQKGGRLPQFAKNGDGILTRLEKMHKVSVYDQAGGNNGSKEGVSKAYAALGFSQKPASAGELKAAYQKLAKQYHKVYGATPNETKYNEIRKAYEYLMETVFQGDS